MKRKILLIYTGGTIGMMKEYGITTLRPFNFQNLLDHIPEIKLLEAEVDYLSFDKPLDSSDIEIADWIKIVEHIVFHYQQYDGFVVLHGTDTMSYTASMISFMLQGLQKPIIFTGSQLPVGEMRTDAKENLIGSIYYASLYEKDSALIREVCLYFGRKLYRANRTTKFSTEHFDAFISPNYPLLGESGVQLDVDKQHLLHPLKKEFSPDTILDNRVEIFTFFPGKRKHLLNEIILNPNIKGLILRAFGSGNIPSDKETLKAIIEAKEQGKELVVVTQCIMGNVDFGQYENSMIFKNLGVVDGKDITIEAAVTKLMWLLGKKYPSIQLKREFEKSLVGELSSK